MIRHAGTRRALAASKLGDEVLPRPRAHARGDGGGWGGNFRRLMHELQMDDRAVRTFFPKRRSQPLHGESHGRGHGTRSFAFDERHSAAGTRDQEIHFQALLVAKVVKLAATARVRLRLDDFRRHKTLE